MFCARFQHIIIINDICTYIVSIFLAKPMLHRSSIINKMVTNIMIIEVMCKAKSPPSKIIRGFPARDLCLSRGGGREGGRGGR